MVTERGIVPTTSRMNSLATIVENRVRSDPDVVEAFACLVAGRRAHRQQDGVWERKDVPAIIKEGMLNAGMLARYEQVLEQFRVATQAPAHVDSRPRQKGSHVTNWADIRLADVRIKRKHVGTTPSIVASAGDASQVEVTMPLSDADRYPTIADAEGILAAAFRLAAAATSTKFENAVRTLLAARETADTGTAHAAGGEPSTATLAHVLASSSDDEDVQDVAEGDEDEALGGLEAQEILRMMNGRHDDTGEGV